MPAHTISERDTNIAVPLPLLHHPRPLRFETVAGSLGEVRAKARVLKDRLPIGAVHLESFDERIGLLAAPGAHRRRAAALEPEHLSALLRETCASLWVHVTLAPVLGYVLHLGPGRLQLDRRAFGQQRRHVRVVHYRIEVEPVTRDAFAHRVQLLRLPRFEAAVLTRLRRRERVDPRAAERHRIHRHLVARLCPRRRRIDLLLVLLQMRS